MIAHEFEQGSPEWLEWRRLGIGSSDIAAVMGASPYMTSMDIFDTKMGFGKEKASNQYMMRGKIYEDEARRAFCKSAGSLYDPLCISHSEIPYFVASLDGYSQETNSIVEIKIPGFKGLQMAREGEIPLHYVYQMQWQLLISGCEMCFYFVYAPESAEMHCIPVKPDASIMATLRKEGTLFWENFLKGIKPSGKKKDVIEINDQEFLDLAAKYIALNAEKKVLEDRMGILKQQIIEHGDDGNFSGGGISCIRSAPRKSYDMEAMKRSGIPIDNYLKASNDIGFYTIRVDK